MIIKPNKWAEFQHYKHRSPPWIKLQKSLLDNYEFHSLPDASKALALCLWLLASEHLEGEIDATHEKLAYRFRTTSEKIEKAIKPLIDNGFFKMMHDDSAALAPCMQSADTEKSRVETETETETEVETETHKIIFVLPDWINKIQWDLWIQTRKGKKMIPAQMQAQVNKLLTWRNDGKDHHQALADAAANGWQGLFEPKPPKLGSVASQSENDRIRESAYQICFGAKNNERV